ncbi:arsenate-mycothiol transferase ArsC [Archaeoglobus veneficus]|uniref:Protein tyrosine phosphatase n=1 Tax=Archaeoglobus veneficus (strain DSM 11195 / SNP6) TaxID=693661 RepID=F2KNZ1_ARCVS|nr:low molecular weight phosphatase family protein [Archaeoglobus veneficus]AEA46299.1 protein tyrosine phosphatase [Archaeoglobus veneficus SNP6]
MKKVLFVCVQNTCRSVMAESIFNSLAKEWKAESAGVEKADRLDDTAIEVIWKFGYSVDKERPRGLDEVNIEEYDFVVTVCSESCAAIPHKNVERWNIEDPKGKDIVIYERVFSEIEKRVKELLDRIED